MEGSFNQIDDDRQLIRLVDQMIQSALQQSASDIHIEPFADGCRIRFRCDGLLYEAAELPEALTARCVARLKIMARLDIAERRLPQDGHFQSFSIDVRMSTCPTLFGEKVVLRLLNTKNRALSIGHLGLSALQQQLLIEKISRPQGLLLVTGPTGSGKTVTLYSVLQYLNSTEKNISTVEDPVEIQLHGINQVNVCAKTALTFATILRALLRQDPDIIMVGEIRDKETALIALQAAHTGHMVLSTLHTDHAKNAIQRLQSMGIAPDMLNQAISLIICQRLVRKLCEECKEQDPLSLEQPALIVGARIFRAVGCKACLCGYRGRTGVYELLSMGEKTTSLKKHALQKVLTGVTSLAEYRRVFS